MYNFNNYDNDIAYGYDDCVEFTEEDKDAYEDYLLQKQQDEIAEQFNALEYQSMMAQQMLDSIHEKM